MLELLYAPGESHAIRLEHQVEDLEDCRDTLNSPEGERYREGRLDMLRDLSDVLALARMADPAGFDYLIRTLDVDMPTVERAVDYQKMGGLECTDF